jgi:hypothetical protein
MAGILPRRKAQLKVSAQDPELQIEPIDRQGGRFPWCWRDVERVDLIGCVEKESGWLSK